MARGSNKGSHSSRFLNLASSVLKQNTPNAFIPDPVEPRNLATNGKRSDRKPFRLKKDLLIRSIELRNYNLNMKQLLDPYSMSRLCH